MTNLPKSWHEVALSDVAEVTSGKTPNNLEARLAEKLRSDRNVPFYKVGDMNASPKYFGTARVYLAVDELATFGVATLPVQTVVFPKAGGAIATNKKRIMRTEGAIDLNCMAVLAKDGLHPSFLFYFFEGTDLSDLATGSVLPQIGKKTVSEMRFVLPPISEQERIVEVLEEQFSRLDRALASVRVVREKAQAFRRSLLHAAFSGELTGGREGWREVSLKDVVDVLDSKRKPVNSKERASRVGSVPYYGATGQVGTIDSHLFDEELVLLGEDGAPFLDPFKPKAYLIRGRSWVNNHAHVLRCRNDVYLNQLMVYFLNNLNYLPFVNGTTRLKLTQGSMNEIPVTVPPLSQQRSIVGILEEQFSRLDNALEVTSNLEMRIASDRRSLLHSAFAGELTTKWRETHV